MSKIITVKMPDIGEGVVEGEIIAWLKQAGDPIAQDEPVVVVMTDKATVELPAPAPGHLAKQYYRVGEIAVKDHPLYDIQTEAKVLAAPPARKLAQELGLDLQAISGTGKEGQVTREDVAAFHAAAAKTPEKQEKPLIGIQQLMAQKVAESKKIIPDFSFFDQADASRLVLLKEKMGQDAEQQGIHLTYLPFFIKALSLCIKKFPVLNSSVDTQRNSVIIHQPHNIGIAMATDLGLVVAVLKDVQEKKLTEIIQAYAVLKQKGKERKLSPSDMKGSTITITNFGALTGRAVFATPIINYPETAILGLAKIHKSPVVVNDQIVIRPVLNCSWSFDHRVIDGYLAAEISSALVHLIENPALLLD